MKQKNNEDLSSKKDGIFVHIPTLIWVAGLFISLLLFTVKVVLAGYESRISSLEASSVNTTAEIIKANNNILLLCYANHIECQK